VEALTHIGSGVPDDVCAETRKEFSEKEVVDLTWAAAAKGQHAQATGGRVV